jgi:LPS export ABC transporter protein LptC
LIFVFPGAGLPKQDEVSDRRLQEEFSQGADQDILSFNLTGYAEGGTKKWELLGRSAHLFPSLVEIDDVTVKIYGEKDSVILTADKGTLNRTNNDVHMKKNVVALTQSGARLTTDSLNWKAKEEVITTPDRVDIQKDNIKITGQEAISQTNLGRVQLNKEVEVKIHPAGKPGSQSQDSQPTVITCDGPMVVEYDKRLATFHNNVHVRDKEGDIYSDKMKVYFSEDVQEGEIGNLSKIEKVVAIGDVKIVKGDNTSFAQEATYIAAQRRITLKGSPRLVIYPEQ